MLRRRSAGSRGPSRFDDWAGVTWSVAIALSFYYISSPLVFVPVFDDSLGRALWITTIASVLTLPLLRVPRVPWAVLPYLGFGLASAAWSINRSDTVHFTGLYVVVTALATVAATNARTRDLARGVVGGALLVMIASVYAYWRDLPGSHVLEGSSGYLAGVGTNRNILAYTMILAFPFAVGFLPRSPVGRVAWIGASLTIAAGILLAESATGVVASFVVAGLALVLGWRDHFAATGRAAGARFWKVVGTVMVSVSVVGVLAYEALGRDLHRDLSLTGRSSIWESIWATSGTRARWIGDGFGSVWMHPWRRAAPNGVFDAITQHLGYYVPHGHSSIMGLVPEVGLVGAALFALTYVVPVLRAWTWLRSPSMATRETGRFVVLGVVALVLAGITEPISTVPLGFYVAVLLIAHDPGAGRDPAPRADQGPPGARGAHARRPGRPGPAPSPTPHGSSGGQCSGTPRPPRTTARAASPPDAAP